MSFGDPDGHIANGHFNHVNHESETLDVCNGNLRLLLRTLCALNRLRRTAGVVCRFDVLVSLKTKRGRLKISGSWLPELG